MSFYVYILQSDMDQSFYKGFSENFEQRLKQHNNGECYYTSSKLPWRLVYVEAQPSKRDALIREKNLKKATTDRLRALVISNKNLLNR